MPDKVMSAKEAVQEFVKDGVMLRSGGIALRKPMALLHEVIRQCKRDITLVTSGFTFDGDLMVGSGCISRLEGSYFGLEALGLSANYRRAQEKSIPQYVPLEEYTNYGMTIRYNGGRDGPPVLPRERSPRQRYPQVFSFRFEQKDSRNGLPLHRRKGNALAGDPS